VRNTRAAFIALALVGALGAGSGYRREEPCDYGTVNYPNCPTPPSECAPWCTWGYGFPWTGWCAECPFFLAYRWQCDAWVAVHADCGQGQQICTTKYGYDCWVGPEVPIPTVAGHAGS
jgi:hypothetical protein